MFCVFVVVFLGGGGGGGGGRRVYSLYYYFGPTTHKPPHTQKTQHRGTSSSDGFGIAWAVAARLASSPLHRCRTLFATHFHELTEMERCVRGRFSPFFVSFFGVVVALCACVHPPPLLNDNQNMWTNKHKHSALPPGAVRNVHFSADTSAAAAAASSSNLVLTYQVQPGGWLRTRVGWDRRLSGWLAAANVKVICLPRLFFSFPPRPIPPTYPRAGTHIYLSLPTQ